MPSSFLMWHWKKELQVFHKNLLLLQNSSNPEAVHDLRVSTKKLRSYTKLYSALFKNNKAVIFFAETKILFSVLGRERNIEISLALFNKFKEKGSLPPIQKHFEFYLGETQQASKFALEHYEPVGLRSLTIEIEKTVSTIDDESIKTDLLKLMRSSASEVKRQVKDFGKNYHLIRKKLKDIFHWNEILPDDFYFSKEVLKTLKSILADLGEAQDHEVLRTNLQYYRKTILAKGNTEYDRTRKLEESVKNSKRKLLDKAGKMIEKSLKEHKKSDPKTRDRLSAPERS
jgi:CHAD domain-containing protein